MRRRKSNIVPGLVLGASFTAVVPACVLTACGGSDPVVNLGNQYYGVAAVAYCCFEGGGVAADAFAIDAKDAALEGDAPSDAPNESDAPGDAREGG
jgi:hypothetical protein